MVEFAMGHAVLRWLVVGAFVGAVGVVLVGLSSSRPAPVDAGGRDGLATGAIGSAVADHESDAAHLLMCAVMLAMLLFPSRLSPHALHGVLLAMAVVFGLLFVDRTLRWYGEGRARSVGRPAVFGRHFVGAVVMCYTMSGHSATGHTGGSPAGVLLGLAVLFLVDAVVVAVPLPRGAARWQLCAHGAHAARLPHAVMGLGMAYMLVEAAYG
ncbi:DUF5134 domain-containing protein [Nocardia paucivorans]|uniref:DUF5134 domain-containing protein n=1 Tax=Nocardia paucivorans TaxID=114259 RepID=UPI0002D850B1|nr:DUF5134 domain-containing protein [Nocardia paucivorans]